MKINYQIQIKVKNGAWYERAKDFPTLEAFEQWDEEKTARFSHQLAFKFKHVVHSIEKFDNIEKSLSFVDENKQPAYITLTDLCIIEFKGEKSEFLIVSESIVDQIYIEKRSKSKTYVYCYIKEDTEFYGLTDNIWLSEAHAKILESKATGEWTITSPAVEVISFGGLMPTFQERNDE